MREVFSPSPPDGTRRQRGGGKEIKLAKKRCWWRRRMCFCSFPLFLSLISGEKRRKTCAAAAVFFPYD